MDSNHRVTGPKPVALPPWLYLIKMRNTNILLYNINITYIKYINI